MAPKKEVKIKSTKPALDETEEEIKSISEELDEVLNPDQVKILKRLVYEIAIVGLQEEEACMLVNFELARLKSLKEKYPVVQRLFDMKNLEYKRGLMKTLSGKARSGDEKLAQWLLESKYPSEFNRRKGLSPGDNGGGDNLLGQAIEFIQKQTSAGGIVTETAGRAFLVKEQGTEKAVLPNLHESLGGRAKEIVEQINKEKGV